MRSVQSIIFSNSLAIVLTIVCVLPITAVFVFSLTAPIDDAFANFGLWLHNKYEWSVATFVTELRFAKVGFALRSVLIALFISFLYYWITNWLNFGLANFRSNKSIGKRSAVAEAINGLGEGTGTAASRALSSISAVLYASSVSDTADDVVAAAGAAGVSSCRSSSTRCDFG